MEKVNRISVREYSRWDAGVIGGGLAGLSLSILLARKGYRVILFEKEKYPFHRVCGEYISMESWNFLSNLGLDLERFDLPIIKKLMVSSPSGNLINAKLDLGGFGISRYFIDYELKKIAERNGVCVMEGTKVNEVLFKDELFTILYNGGEIECKVASGCFGKRSNLDVKWLRGFLKKKQGKLNNYIGVKYHIMASFPIDTIALHNFKNGYCGISAIEKGAYCLCYLTTAQNLMKNNNSIKTLEEKVLFRNPFLKEIFSQSEFLFKEPVTISQISFDKKTQVENHVMMMGDAAGMIAPLCGNGMSMALHSSKIAFQAISLFLAGHISRAEMEGKYKQQWKSVFNARLRAGRMIQYLFGKEYGTNFFIEAVSHLPPVLNRLIKATHGKEF